jgi:steroid 5-alpha reductase family enzyme
MALISWGAAALVMLTLWLIHLRTENAAIVDVGWAGNFTLIALIALLMADGDSLRKLLICGMASLWSLRLTVYLYRRVVGHEEEGRYQQLRKQWGKNIGAKFFLFFQFQALLNVILSLPFFIVVVNSNPRISILEWLGMILWLIAIVGESLADQQLKNFKSRLENHGKVCQTGLWRYSRHPNYFFEWLIWVAFFVFALASPYGYVSVISPALMLYFLFKITGIPAAEEQAIRSKGEAYREYQRTTSAFVPWFPSR